MRLAGKHPSELFYAKDRSFQCLAQLLKRQFQGLKWLAWLFCPQHKTKMANLKRKFRYLPRNHKAMEEPLASDLWKKAPKGHLQLWWNQHFLSGCTSRRFCARRQGPSQDQSAHRHFIILQCYGQNGEILTIQSTNYPSRIGLQKDSLHHIRLAYIEFIFVTWCHWLYHPTGLHLQNCTASYWSVLFTRWVRWSECTKWVHRKNRWHDRSTNASSFQLNWHD